jgi:hypothetical protein
MEVAAMRRQMLSTAATQSTQREVVQPAVVMAGAGPVTLKQLLASLGSSTRLTVSAALYVGEQLARAIGELHERGRVHGLLSPHLVHLSADGSVRLAPPEGAPRPASAYLAPETRNGEAPDVLADVHAIGAMMFEMLTGMTVLQAYVRAPMRELTKTPVPSLFNPGVDQSIDDLVTASVDRDPAQRPHSVRALQAGIAHCFGELDLEPSPAELAALVSERFPAAAMIPMQAPTPALAAAVAPVAAAVAAPRLVTKPAQEDLVPAPSSDEGFDAVAPTSRFNVRRHLAQVEAETEFEEGSTGSTEIPLPATWMPSRKAVTVGAVIAAALAAVMLVVVTWPAPKVVQADDVPPVRTEAKVKVVPVAPPAPVEPSRAQPKAGRRHH